MKVTMMLADAAALPAIARRLSDAGCYRWRREAFDIRAEPDGPVLARLDRGALPEAAMSLNQIRIIVGINLLLGVLTIVIGGTGPYW